MFLVSEVGVEVVQITMRLRPHVRQKDIASFLKTKARHRLELAITRPAVVLQQELIRRGLEKKISARAPILVTKAEQQSLRDLMIELHIPREAVRILQVFGPGVEQQSWPSNRRDAIRGKGRDQQILILLERTDVERNLVVEDSDAAADDGR